MRYVDKVLGKNEQVLHETRLHWIILVGPAIVAMLAVAAASFVNWSAPSRTSPALVVFTCFGLLSVLGMMSAIIRLWTTEIAVTTRRIIYKKGLVARDTIEINMNKVESIDVRQTILGRMLNFGTVVVRGTGGGLEPMQNVDGPIDLRNAAFET